VSALLQQIRLHDVEDRDLEEVVALERLAFPVPWKREYFGAEVQSDHRFNRVARGENGELAGYLFCAFAGGEVHINKIAVSESWRRRGVAGRLMSEVLDFSRRIEAEDVYLEVRESNHPARTFYRSIGFVDSGRRKSYYLDGEDALVMVLALLDEHVSKEDTPSETTVPKRRWR
jgi:ribosomal-protein-alanine N-acetyltransferase